MAATFAGFGSAAANPRPNVRLELRGDVVRHDRNGDAVLAPLGGPGLKPGQTVRYLIVASNLGPGSASHLVPEAKIPSGTAYEAGSASTASAARIEFSLDGGKTWAVKPLVRASTAGGEVERPADPSLYTTVRWIGATTLAPKSSVTYSYQVRVK